MGLDCYWVDGDPTTDDWEHVRLDLPEHHTSNILTGFVVGGPSDGGFRGKAYNEFFEAYLNEPLYQDISPERVSEMAEELSELLWMDVEPDGYDGLPRDRDEFEALRASWEAAAERGCGMHAWW